jgi:hypothetical protein
MWHRLILVGCFLVSSCWGCGNGVVIISVNSGTIVGAPRCGTPGQFDLREPGGLTVLVVITDNTRIILAGGGTGSCSSLSADAAVQVSGRRSGDQIVATVVTIE